MNATTLQARQLVSYLLFASEPQDLAYSTSQALGLFFTGDYHENYGGQGERWLFCCRQPMTDYPGRNDHHVGRVS